MSIDLRLGDCLEIMPTLAAQSFDAIIADIPYGTTACKWDTVIPFAPMWENLKRLAKPKAAIVLFGSQPFTSALVMSNACGFRMVWYWRKERGTNFQNSRTSPMKVIEECLVFSKETPIYNPQKVPIDKPYKHVMPIPKKNHSQNMDSLGIDENGNRIYKRYNYALPENVLCFARDNMSSGNSLHPTQKPVALMEYLIRTYTNEGDTVLDFTMGSGTTMVACVNTNRNGTGIEKDTGYFAIAERRVKEAQAQLSMPIFTNGGNIGGGNGDQS